MIIAKRRLFDRIWLIDYLSSQLFATTRERAHSYMKNIYFYFLPFLFFILGYCGISWFVAIPTSTMPSLIGVSLHKGITVLSEKQLNVRIIAEKDDNSIDAGTILNQIPQAGQRVKQNQPVFLTLSKKPEKIKAPDLILKNFAQATELLKQQNIKLKTYSLNHLAGSSARTDLIAQWPKPGTALEKKLMILYHAAPEENNFVIFPDLTGQDLEEVQNFLKMHNAQVEVTYPAMPNKQKQFIVKNHKPLAGSLVDLKNSLLVRLQVENQS